MTDRTHCQLASTYPQYFDQLMFNPRDTLRASIHPTRQTITVNYWSGGGALVLNVTHIDALVFLLAQVKEALAQLAAEPDDVVRAAVTRSYWPGHSANVAPIEVLLALLLRVKGAGK